MKKVFAISLIPFLTACSVTQQAVSERPEYFGTKHPFAKEAIYFVMTDRFVDGDPSNNHEDQGGAYPTWQLPMPGPDGQVAYVGYMGGDYQGVLNNAQYIKDLGFTSVWLTPILDNPDQHFTGGDKITFDGGYKDGGKTGYHGYWATNFYQEDEHLLSPNLNYRALTSQLKNDYGLKVVFDLVANHGSPSYSMPTDQPMFGELYDAEGKLVADHQNIKPNDLSSIEPAHQFFNKGGNLAQLSDLNTDNPEVKEYLINSYLYWIEQGADAFRIDTIKWVPHRFWKEMADRIRAQYPDFYMFGEAFDYDAELIAQHTLPENGNIAVLDFPGRQAMNDVFGYKQAPMSELLDYLHLQNGPYHNPYELTTFYDNHDMARMDANDKGFINAHNWLFTSRGIPVIYQGSEIGFMRGKYEHVGNRNYLGQERLDQAPQHEIYQHLQAIAKVRQNSIALQKGVQLNMEFAENTAAFYRVYQDQQQAQIALVLLNKGDTNALFEIAQFMQAGTWVEQLTQQTQQVSSSASPRLVSEVQANSVQVWLLNDSVQSATMQQALQDLIN